MSNSPIGLGVKALADGLDSMANTVILLTIVVIIAVPLAIWKLIDIGIWILSRLV